MFSFKESNKLYVHRQQQQHFLPAGRSPASAPGSQEDETGIVMWVQGNSVAWNGILAKVWNVEISQKWERAYKCRTSAIKLWLTCFPLSTFYKWNLPVPPMIERVSLINSICSFETMCGLIVYSYLPQSDSDILSFKRNVHVMGSCPQTKYCDFSIPQCIRLSTEHGVRGWLRQFFLLGYSLTGKHRRICQVRYACKKSQK